MKKILSLLAIVGLGGLLLTGCASTPQNTATQDATITLSTSLGTYAYLSKNPNDAIYFVGAEQALYSIANGTNDVTITTVEGALNKANVNNNPVIAGSITEAIQLGESLIQSSAGTNTSAQVVVAKRVSGDIALGIGQGLAEAGVASLKK